MKKYVFIYITIFSFLLCSCAKSKDTKSTKTSGFTQGSTVVPQNR